MWIDLRQTKTKMILCPFYTYRRIQSFHQRKCVVLRQLSVCHTPHIPFVTLERGTKFIFVWSYLLRYC